MAWDWSVVGLVLAGLMVAIGVAGTVLPVLPGSVLVLAGLVLAAWMEDFRYTGAFTIGLLVVLTGLAQLVDVVAAALGARRFGSSPRAVLGACLGTIVGVFFGLPGILLGPFIGAVIGELTVQRNLERAGRAGVGATVGFLLGTAGKLALCFCMIGVFAWSRWL